MVEMLFRSECTWLCQARIHGMLMKRGLTQQAQPHNMHVNTLSSFAVCMCPQQLAADEEAAVVGPELPGMSAAGGSRGNYGGFLRPGARPTSLCRLPVLPALPARREGVLGVCTGLAAESSVFVETTSAWLFTCPAW